MPSGGGSVYAIKDLTYAKAMLQSRNLGREECFSSGSGNYLTHVFDP